MGGWIPLISVIVLLVWVISVIAIFQIHSYTKDMSETLKEILDTLNKKSRE